MDFRFSCGKYIWNPSKEEVVCMDLGLNTEVTEFANLRSMAGVKSFIVECEECDYETNTPYMDYDRVPLGERTIIDYVENVYNPKDVDYYIGMLPVIRIDKLEYRLQRVMMSYIKMCLTKDKPILIGKYYQDLKENYISSLNAHINETEEYYQDAKDDYINTASFNSFEDFSSIFNKKPIEWRYCEKTKSLISKKILLPFKIDYFRDYIISLDEEVYNGLQEVINLIGNDSISLSDAGYIDNEKAKVKTIDNIEKLVESNVPVFLHGKPGEGKSQRVKEIDPDCTTLELSLIPVEDLSGITICNNDVVKTVKPEWLVDLEKKCKEEPEKNHVLFLDELTNAVPTIQQLAYSLVLERKVANTWNLPENVRIIAAGNEIEDSCVATEMPTPLFDRFAHVDIHTTVEEWIEWAQKSNVHPAIISYIAYKGENVLRAEPMEGEDNAITPRTWERASKQLKVTNDVRDLIPILGTRFSAGFVSYCRLAGITKEKILTNSVDEDLMSSLDVGMKSAIVSNLTNATIEEYPIIREFVKKGGREITSLLDSLWIAEDKNGSSERLEKVAELKLAEEQEEEEEIDYEYEIAEDEAFYEEDIIEDDIEY